MTHDPLCPALEGEGLFVAYAGPVGGSDDIDCLTCAVIGDCLTCAVIGKVREDEQTRIYSNEEIEAVIRLTASKAYDAALRDAVAAVRAEQTSGRHPEFDPECREQAVAAIEALGGER